MNDINVSKMAFSVGLVFKILKPVLGKEFIDGLLEVNAVTNVTVLLIICSGLLALSSSWFSAFALLMPVSINNFGYFLICSILSSSFNLLFFVPWSSTIVHILLVRL